MITILDKISPPSPKFVRSIKPTVFKTTLEKEKYWETQKTYWREGYGEGYARICGMHYYYMQECFLKDGSDGDIIRPRYRDCDDWIISEIHKEFWNPTGAIGFIKRREIGLTSIGSGLLPFYTFRMFPSSTFGMTSADKDRIYKAYTDKTQVNLTELDQEIRPQIIKKSETQQSVYLQLATNTKNEAGETVVRYADLFSKETAQSDKSASGFSGTRMKAAFFDELPLHPRNKLLLRSSKACFMKGAEYNGLLLWGGTVEQTLTASQIQEFQKLVSDASILQHKIIFIPVWWGLFMNEAGESDEKKGLEWWEKEFERLSKSDDPSDAKAFRMNYPKSLDDVFELGNGSRWEEYTRERINLRVKELLREKPPIGGYDIIETPDGELKSIPNQKSTLRILEHPKEGVKYVLAVDATQSTEGTSGAKGNSKFAMTIMKGVDPQSEIQFAPVAAFLERPKDFDSTFDKAIRILKYYNKYGNAKICGELNATGGVLAEKITKSGLNRCHIRRRDLNKKGIVDTNKIWYYRVDATIDWQYLAGNTYFKKYVDYVHFIDILYDAQKPDNANTDLLDSFLGCLWGFGTGNLIEEKPKDKVKRAIMMLKYENGKPVWYEKEFANTP